VIVKVSGTATVAIKVEGIDGYFVLPESLEVLIAWMRHSTIPEFTSFVRRD
jgi:hypothetical protein